MKSFPPPMPPSFETEEELWKLTLEGIASGEGVEMTPEEWVKLRAELGVDDLSEKLAS